MKKRYYICIGGETIGECERHLTQEEFKLIQGIFNECESQYDSGEITEIPEHDDVVKAVKDFMNASGITDEDTREFLCSGPRFPGVYYDFIQKYFKIPNRGGAVWYVGDKAKYDIQYPKK